MASKFRRHYPQTFAADFEGIADLTEKRALALARQSLQDVIINANTPTAKGGRMRVDTGFLRASGQGSLTGMPTGPVRGDSDTRHYYDDGSGQPVIAALGRDQFKLGVVFHYGWTAAYAQYREIYDGFLEGALQRWPQIVAFNLDTIMQRIKK